MLEDGNGSRCWDYIERSILEMRVKLDLLLPLSPLTLGFQNFEGQALNRIDDVEGTFF